MRQQIGEQLAAQLFAAETAIDVALRETATLAALLPQSRADAYLSATTGQRAFDGAAGAIRSLTDARGQLIDTHRTLAALARSLGLEVLAAGPTDKPEDRPQRGSGLHNRGVGAMQTR